MFRNIPIDLNLYFNLKWAILKYFFDTYEWVLIIKIVIDVCAVNQRTMEFHAGPQYDYSDVVETLASMFGDVVSADVIFSVVESCGGDCKYNQKIINLYTFTRHLWLYLW